MAAPHSGDGSTIPGTVLTDDVPSSQYIGFNETVGGHLQELSPPATPQNAVEEAKPQIVVNPTIRIVLIVLGIVVVLLFLFGILAGCYIAHRNKRARLHQEALDREEEQRLQQRQHRQLSVKKKHIAINTILDQKAQFLASDNNDEKNHADRAMVGGSSSDSDVGLENSTIVDRESEIDLVSKGAGPRRESFLTLTPVGHGITLWPDSSSHSLVSAGGGSIQQQPSSRTDTPATEVPAALYSKEFGSKSQQGAMDESSLSNNNSSRPTTLRHSSSTSILLLRDTPCPPGVAQGTLPQPSSSSSSDTNKNTSNKMGYNTKNSFTEVAQIYAHRQSLVDPLGLQTLASASTALPPSSGDRVASSAFPSPLSPPLPLAAPPHPPPSHSHSGDWQQATAPAGQPQNPFSQSKNTSVVTLSQYDDGRDGSNTAEAPTAYETAITISSEINDSQQPYKCVDMGSGVSTAQLLSGSAFEQQQQEQEPKPFEEPEEVIIYPKVVPRRKKSSNAYNHLHLDLQLPPQGSLSSSHSLHATKHRQQRSADLAAYRHSIMVPSMAHSSVEISYQPPSQPTSPTGDAFDRPSSRRGGLSHSGRQEALGDDETKLRQMYYHQRASMILPESAAPLRSSREDRPSGSSSNIESVVGDLDVMPEVVPRRPRTATFPHRPINYRHSQYMHHESRPSLNASMNRRTMYGFGELMSMSSADEQQPKPEPFTVSRSKTVYDASMVPQVQQVKSQSSISATTQRLRRKWAGGEMSIETTVPTHSGVGSSIGSIHSRRNERSFAGVDDDEESYRPQRGRASLERYQGGGASSNVGPSGSGQEHVVVSMPSPRGRLLEDDQHNAEKQFYEMMNFLQGQGDSSTATASKGSHMRQQSHRNPYQQQAFPQQHQRFQSYTPSKRQSYYPPQYHQPQQQNHTFSYERTSFDRSFPNSNLSAYQNAPSQSNRMSYVDDYYRAQQQQPQQPSTSKREAGRRRTQSAFKRLSAVFGGNSGHASDEERSTRGDSSVAATSAAAALQLEEPSGGGRRYREGGPSGQRRRGLMTDEERLKRQTIAVMNDQLMFGRPNQEMSFSGLDHLEHQQQQQPSSSPQQQQRHRRSSSSQQRQYSHQQQQQQQYRQGSSFSSRDYRADKNRRATMYDAVSSHSGRYSSDLVRQTDYLAENPAEECDVYDHEGYHGGGHDEERHGHRRHHDGEEEEDEENDEVRGGQYDHAGEEDMDDGHYEDEEERGQVMEEEHGYPDVQGINSDEYGGFGQPQTMKQQLQVPGGRASRRTPSSPSESVTVGALSSSSALDEDEGRAGAATQPLKKMMKIFK